MLEDSYEDDEEGDEDLLVGALVGSFSFVGDREIVPVLFQQLFQQCSNQPATIPASRKQTCRTSDRARNVKENVRCSMLVIP